MLGSGTSRRVLVLVFLVVWAVGSWSSKPSPGAPPTQVRALPSAALRERVLKTYADLPLEFEANRGQTDAQVRFLARGPGYRLFLTPQEAFFVLARSQSPPPGRPVIGPFATRHKGHQVSRPRVVRMRLVDAHPAPEIVGLEQLPGKVNYFIGN